MPARVVPLVVETVDDLMSVLVLVLVLVPVLVPEEGEAVVEGTELTPPKPRRTDCVRPRACSAVCCARTLSNAEVAGDSYI